MKKIAIDLDGVILDSENLFRVYAEIYDTDVLKTNNLVDNSERRVQERYNWDKKVFDDFYNKYSTQILSNPNLMTGVDIVLKKLMDNFEIIIVSAKSNEEMKLCEDCLKQIGIDKIQIFNNEINKMDRLLTENCNYIIDDDEKICKQAAQNGINSIYLKNAAANPVCDEKNFKTVNNWGEIYKYLILNNK